MANILFYQNQDVASPKWPPLRQTFLGLGLVAGTAYRYIIDENQCKADYLLAVADGVIPTVTQTVQKERRIVVLMENPGIWTPSLEYLSYFGVFISPAAVDVPQGTRLIISHPAISWFYGLRFHTDQGLSHVPILNSYLQLDDLATLQLPEKKKLLSCVVSGKVMTPGHAWRVEIAQALKQYFGSEIDMYGFGWNPVSDKRDAIDPYLFSIAIENASIDNYWTEKLSDVILGYAQPIYSGASNVLEYFQHTFPTIPYGIAATEFVEKVKSILSSEVNALSLYERRHQLMYQHNLFYCIAGMIRDGIV